MVENVILYSLSAHVSVTNGCNCGRAKENMHQE